MDFEPKSTDFDGLDGLVKRLGLAWLAFFEVETSRVKPRPKPKTKPTQAELGLAWLGLPFSKCKQAVQADRLGSTPSHPSHPSRGKRTSLQ